MCCCKSCFGFFSKVCGAMSLDETRQSQRPYRYGMVLLCIGALINWLGLAENYVEPVRYIGVACIIAGALLICAAMCCWLQAPGPRPSSNSNQMDDPIQVITVPTEEEVMQQKPPDYDSVAGAPPTYDDAIKLNPAHFLPSVHMPTNSQRTSNARTDDSTPSRSYPANEIPGQLESVITENQCNSNQVPATPPPPYRSIRTVR